MLQLRQTQPLLVQRQRQCRPGFLQVERLANGGLTDPDLLAGQIDLQGRIAAQLGLLEPELARLDLEPRAAEDDLLSLFGEVMERYIFSS